MMEQRDKRHRRNILFMWSPLEPLRRNVLEWVAHRIAGGISPPSSVPPGLPMWHWVGPEGFSCRSDIGPGDAQKAQRCPLSLSKL